ncbi:ferredoxin, 2Fe-2S [mine drainage metagenome]|uniref:Ferredoxin, 2Fe-2S n=1 Tax=mine drainage metagenome TaxID=410659 RepID=A0A1J5RZN4_9ZZZZ
MSFYACHLFVCTNYREGAPSCAGAGAGDAAVIRLKNVLAQSSLPGSGRARVSRAGCLGRCGEGPVVVAYPQAKWYRYANDEDLDEIAAHLSAGKAATRLEITPDPGAIGDAS